MNQKQILKTLTSLGLTETDATVYLFLAREGPQKGKDMSEALSFYRQQLYRSLKRLQNRGLVCSTLERPARFSAVSIEKVLEFLSEAKKEQALALKESKKELLSTWRAIAKNTADS